MNELTSEFSSTLPPLETWRTPIGVPRAVHPQEEIRRRLRAQGLLPPGRMALHCYLADHGWSVEAWSPALMQKEQNDLGAFLAGHSPLMQQAARLQCFQLYIQRQKFSQEMNSMDVAQFQRSF